MSALRYIYALEAGYVVTASEADHLRQVHADIIASQADAATATAALSGAGYVMRGEA